jgi:hypothetical protein
VTQFDNLIALLSILGLLIVGALAGLLLLPVRAARYVLASVKRQQR